MSNKNKGFMNTFSSRTFLMNTMLTMQSWFCYGLLSLAIVFPIVFSVTVFVTKNNIIDFSWIYIAIWSVLLLVFDFASVYRLLVESKKDGFDRYFSSKGVSRIKLIFQRFLAIYSVSAVIILVHAIVLCLSFVGISATIYLGQYVAMILLGSLLFQFFMLPLFICAADIKLEMFYIIIASILVVCPITSIFSRINQQKENAVQINKDYVTSYSFSNNKATTYKLKTGVETSIW